MLYRYNRPTMRYKKISLFITTLSFLFIFSLGYFIGNYKTDKQKEKTQPIKSKVLSDDTKNTQLSDEVVLKKLKEYRVKHPETVLAQAKHESRNYTSNVYKKTNNLFGMRLAYNRPTIRTGSYKGYSIYKTWEDSVLDYALYQAAYLNKIKNEKEYIRVISKVYAEDPNYINFTKHMSRQ